MTKNIKEIMSEVVDLNVGIKRILTHAAYDYYDDLSGIEADRSDAEQLFMPDELRQILSNLDEVSHTINYLSRSIKAEGVLHKNSNGRYEVNGIELTSGSGLEYLADDGKYGSYDDNDNCLSTPYWKASRIEHDGSDYYIVGSEKGSLENVRVRIRK